MLTNRRHRRKPLHLTDYRTNIRERRIVAVGGCRQPIVLRDELVDLGLEAALHVGVPGEGEDAGGHGGDGLENVYELRRGEIQTSSKFAQLCEG